MIIAKLLFFKEGCTIAVIHKCLVAVYSKSSVIIRQ